MAINYAIESPERAATFLPGRPRRDGQQCRRPSRGAGRKNYPLDGSDAGRQTCGQLGFQTNRVRRTQAGDVPRSVGGASMKDMAALEKKSLSASSKRSNVLPKPALAA